MARPGVLAKQSFVIILSGFKKTEAHLFNSFPEHGFFFFPQDTEAESLADYG